MIDISRRKAMLTLTASGAISVALGTLCTDAYAETPYPNRAIRLVVPFPAGTSPDVMARLWADSFQKNAGQPVIVDNRAGASTIIATQLVGSAPNDGYTLLWTVNNTFSINPYVYQKLPYKTEDFIPITRILSVPYVLVVSGQSRLRNLDDLIQEARAKPGTLTYASAGIGTGLHVAMARFLNAAGISMVHVPYKDYFATDLIAQRIDVAFDATTTSLQQIQAGKYRALAITSTKRIESLPDVPAIAETYPGFIGDSWHGIFARKGTPESAIAYLESHSRRIVETPAFQASLRGYGLTPVDGSASSFQAFLKEDARAWEKVVRDNKISID